MRDVVRIAGLILSAAGLGLATLAADDAGVALVRNASFDIIDGDRAADWRLSNGVRAAKGSGHNGSGGLVWESAGPSAAQAGAAQDIPLEKGEIYHFSALVRTENFKSDRGGVGLCVEWYDGNGKWLNGDYAASFRDANSGWTVLECATRVIPPEAARVTLQFYVGKGSSGKVSFDNAVVTPLVRPPVGFVFSSAYRNLAVSGPVRFHAALFPRKELTLADLSAEFSYTDASGRLRRVKPTRFVRDEATLALDVSDLAKGRQRVTCRMSDRSGKTLGEAFCDFTRADKLPRRRVWIDDRQRCIVDGKPFFPLGMYSGKVTADWIDTYAKGPFNCVMPYSHTDKEQLDLCQSKNILCFGNFHNINRSSAWARACKITTREQLAAHCRKEIAALKDHPALFAWYVNDEASVTEIPDLCFKYELFCAEDDQHPTWAVMDRLYDLREFIPSYDVLGIDPYPVAQHPISQVTEHVRGTQVCNYSDRPLWNVPQAFNWGWCRKDQAAKERFPTEQEFRSMCWQHIAGGANGLVSYAFHHFLRDIPPEEFESHWGRICRPSEEIRRLMPVLLSVEPAPVVTGMPPDLPVRVWCLNGELYVLACNIRNTPLAATLKIASGRWRPVAAEVGPRQAMSSPDALEIDLPAFGVTMTRLSAF